MDEQRNSGGRRAFLVLAFLASAASIAAAGQLAGTDPDIPLRAALALPFALLALPVAAFRLNPAIRRAAIASGASPIAVARHLVLPLCGPFVLPVWLLAIAYIAMPALPSALAGALAGPATWAPYALLAIATYTGLLRHIGTTRPTA